MRRNWRASDGRRYQNAKGLTKYLAREGAQENTPNALGMAPIDSRLGLAAVPAVSLNL
jgi:hypothetical protein